MSGPISGQIAIDDVSLAFTDRGTGRPILFQHGLGGNEAQVAEVFPDDEGFRRLTLDCRGQGASAPDPQNRYAIRQFAEDALRLADSRRIGRFVAGGISMGAAIALHLAVHHPARVTALILARPAWLFAPAPATMAPYAEVAALLETPDGLATFDASETAAMLAREAPANLTSLRGFFTLPDARVTAALLGAGRGRWPGRDTGRGHGDRRADPRHRPWPGCGSHARLCRDARRHHSRRRTRADHAQSDRRPSPCR